MVAYGSHEQAEVLVDSNSTMYFKPTCVNTQSSRLYAVRNLSRLPINFHWKMKQSDAAVLSVHPTSGTIQPNEKQVVDAAPITLTPNTVRDRQRNATQGP